jgi:hypothetical protein
VDGDIGTVQSRIELHCHPKYTSGKKLTAVRLNFVYSGAFALVDARTKRRSRLHADWKSVSAAEF